MSATKEEQQLKTWWLPPCVPTAAEKTSQTSGEPNFASQPGEEEYGDLIQFYNTIFVLKVKSFALRYASSDSEVWNQGHVTLWSITASNNGALMTPKCLSVTSGGSSSSLSFPIRQSSASFSSPGFPETLVVRVPTQEFHREPHGEFLLL